MDPEKVHCRAHKSPAVFDVLAIRRQNPISQNMSLRSISILSYLRLDIQSMLFPSGSWAKICEMFRTCYIPHPPPFYHPNILWWWGTKRVASLCIISAPPLIPDIPLSILFSGSRSFSLNLRDQVPHPLKRGGGSIKVSHVFRQSLRGARSHRCHISGSHSGVVAESCVPRRHFVSLGLYRYAPHNDVSVNDAPHIRRRSHMIIIL